MNRNVLLLCLLFFSPHVFAGLSVWPESSSVSLHGGETVVQQVVVFNDSSYAASVGLEAFVSNVSGDLNGFSVAFSPRDFVLDAGERRQVDLFFSAVPGIAPEPYVVEARVVAFSSVPDALPLEPVVSSGVSGWMGRRVFLDENKGVDGDGVVPVVEPLPSPAETVVEPLSVDLNEPVEGPEPLPEAKPKGLLPWQHAVIAFILAPCFLGVIALLLFARKRRENDGKSKEKNS